MEDFLREISENMFWRIAVPVGVLLVVTGLALLLRAFVYGRLHKWAAKTETEWDDILIHDTRIASLLWCFFLGIFAAVHLAVVPESWEEHVISISPILLIVMGIYTGIIVVRILIDMYIVGVAQKTASPLDDMIMGAHKWIIPIVASFLGAVLVLDLLNIPALERRVLEDDRWVRVGVVPVVEDWLRVHGPTLGLMWAIGLVLVLAATATIPKIVEGSVQRSRGDQSQDEVKKRSDTLSGVLVASLQAIILAVIFFMMLSDMGLNIAPMIAGVGVLGIAIGFGAQSLVKDIISGLFILLENQYRKGDVIRIASTSGVVEDINLRRTLLRDLDGIVHTVPNGEISVSSNFTKSYSRVNLNISVGYNEDLDRVIAVINRVGRELAEDPAWSAQILKPPQVLRVDNLGDSGIDIKVTGDTKPIQQWAIMGELRLRIKKAFDQEGIEIPWPHTKVYFGNALDVSPKQNPKKT